MNEVQGKWEHDPFWGGFSKFVDENFEVSMETILQELEDANRYQKGPESIAQLLESRGSLGEAVLRIIELYIQQYRRTNRRVDIDANAPYSSGHL